MKTMKKNNITILAFDTATNACSVALRVGDRMYARHEIAPRMHASLILPLIQAVLSEAGIELSAVDAIAFGFGPGSFMGVRLATGMAQGLAFGLQIPVIPVSTLQTLAQTAYEKTQDSLIAAAWDARMNEIYCGIYAVDDQDIMQCQREDTVCTPASIDTGLWGDVPCSLVGNAWSVYENQLPDALTAQNIMKHTAIYPEATAMVTIATSKYLNNESLLPENVHPHYVRHHVVHD